MMGLDRSRCGFVVHLNLKDTSIFRHASTIYADGQFFKTLPQAAVECFIAEGLHVPAPTRSRYRPCQRRSHCSGWKLEELNPGGNHAEPPASFSLRSWSSASPSPVRPRTATRGRGHLGWRSSAAASRRQRPGSRRRSRPAAAVFKVEGTRAFQWSTRRRCSATS